MSNTNQPAVTVPSKQDISVQEAIKDLLALRKLTAATGTRTDRTQNELLRQLDAPVLVRVARILVEMEEAGR
jgi:hypothetical protein